MEIFLFLKYDRYRNYDRKTIRELLKEIGRHRYEQALEQKKVTQKPLGMEGWYLGGL